MCAAFAHRAEVYLFSFGSGGDSESVYELYRVPPVFEMELVERAGPPFSRIRSHMRAVRELLGRQAPDLYYGRHPLWLWITSHRGVPVLYEMHRLPRTRLEDLVTRALFTSKQFQGLVVISDALKRDVLSRYRAITDQRVLTARDGADPLDGLESIAKHSGFSGERRARKIGYVGSLLPGRGIELILVLAERLPEMRFLVVGGSEGQVRAWESRAGSNNVNFVGHVPHREIGRHLLECDILLAPYQTTVEVPDGGDTARWMSPMKLFEYMSSGRPIVASDLPVLREILSEDENARLVAPADVDAWVAAVLDLADDAATRGRLGKAALSDLLRKYTWRKRAERVLDWVTALD